MKQGLIILGIGLILIGALMVNYAYDIIQKLAGDPFAIVFSVSARFEYERARNMETLGMVLFAVGVVMIIAGVYVAYLKPSGPKIYSRTSP